LALDADDKEKACSWFPKGKLRVQDQDKRRSDLVGLAW
jgi:hypothetical protein